MSPQASPAPPRESEAGRPGTTTSATLPTVWVTAVDESVDGGVATAAAIAATWSETAGRAVVIVEVDDGSAELPVRKPTLMCTSSAREVEELLLAEGFAVAARGRNCWVRVKADSDDNDGRWLLKTGAVAELACGNAGGVVVWAPAVRWREAIDEPGTEVSLAVVRTGSDPPRDLLRLLGRELVQRGVPLAVTRDRPGILETRKAIAGLAPGPGTVQRYRRIIRRVAGEDGQSLPLIAGLVAVVLVVAVALAAFGGAATGKIRMQRAADLAALAAARSMHDDLPRALASPERPDGTPNPARLERGEYLERAARSAVEVAIANGAGADNVKVTFPDAAPTPPLRVRVRIAGQLSFDRRPVTVSAEAEVGTGIEDPGAAATARGGGYQGPLAYRQGVPMRPDVAAGFDRMAAAARQAGVALVINSGYRSDAQQARLFAANPDPKWVAPPGRSLHRCGTELDLGPAGSYGWLAANAARFGFRQRYPWEPWHYGWVAGPPPCASGPVPRSGWAEPARPGGSAEPPPQLPAWVPARYRQVITSTAARHNLPAIVLAAQLQAESGFRPDLVSPAGAAGIAQFMPATAAEWGLADRFDPVASIRAQGRFMASLHNRFKSMPLALAAYNAGPAPVAACRCIPPYPETRTYVARILALVEGSGGNLEGGSREVRLVD